MKALFQFRLSQIQSKCNPTETGPTIVGPITHMDTITHMCNIGLYSPWSGTVGSLEKGI